ncbi:hypothetical protein OROMI_006251 [Orobanche minor]
MIYTSNGLCSIYPSRVADVKPSEISNLFFVRSKPCTIIVGTFARVKSGKYKGDLAQLAEKNRKVKQRPQLPVESITPPKDKNNEQSRKPDASLNKHCAF